MTWKLLEGDVMDKLAEIETGTIQCCVTSPPYWGLRDYGVDGQIGLESTPEEYVGKLVRVFREVRRVLREDGTLWLNLGDSYAGGGRAGNNEMYHIKHKMFGTIGHNPGVFGRPQPIPVGLKPKDLVGIPWRVAFALQADDWYLRSDIIWAKSNPMPESVTDRPTKSHEYIFLLTKASKYYYDHEAIKESGVTHTYDKRYGPGAPSRNRENECWNQQGPAQPHRGFKTLDTTKGRNKRSVWSVATEHYNGAHFAVFPPKLIEPCILAGSPLGGLVLDPFAGSGTTLYVSERFGRDSIGIELSPEYCGLIKKRMSNFQQIIFQEVRL